MSGVARHASVSQHRAGGDAESLGETTEAGFQSLCNSVLNWAPQGYIPIGFLSVYAGVGFQLFETPQGQLDLLLHPTGVGEVLSKERVARTCYKEVYELLRRLL